MTEGRNLLASNRSDALVGLNQQERLNRSNALRNYALQIADLRTTTISGVDSRNITNLALQLQQRALELSEPQDSQFTLPQPAPHAQRSLSAAFNRVPRQPVQNERPVAPVEPHRPPLSTYHQIPIQQRLPFFNLPRPVAWSQQQRENIDEGYATDVSTDGSICSLETASHGTQTSQESAISSSVDLESQGSHQESSHSADSFMDLHDL